MSLPIKKHTSILQFPRIYHMTRTGLPIITCDATLLKYIVTRWRHVEREQRSCKKRTLIIFYMQRISSPISRSIFLLDLR